MKESPEIEALAKVRPVPLELNPEVEGERIFECQGCGEQGPFHLGYQIEHWANCPVVAARIRVENERSRALGVEQPHPHTAAFRKAPLTLVSSPSKISTKRCFACYASVPDSYVGPIDHEPGCPAEDAQQYVESTGARPSFLPFSHAVAMVPPERIEDDPNKTGLRTYECPNCHKQAQSTDSSLPDIEHGGLCLYVMFGPNAAP